MYVTKCTINQITIEYSIMNPEHISPEEVGRKLRSRAKKSITAVNVLSRRYFCV